MYLIIIRCLNGFDMMMLYREQVLAARATGKVDGFAFFRYALFNKNEAKKEVSN